MTQKSAIDAIIHPFNLSNRVGTMETRNIEGKEVRVRAGKTARDKANGHTPYKKNRRIWSDSKTSSGQWVKV